MSYDSIRAKTLEEIFLAGYHVPSFEELEDMLEDCDHLSQTPTVFKSDAVMFIESAYSTKIEKYSNPQVNIDLSIKPEGKWLAIHEAGHAIAGLAAGFPLIGVRFFYTQRHAQRKGAGVAVFPDEEFLHSDEEKILNLISVDVAGNISQLMMPEGGEPEGGVLSDMYLQNLTIGMDIPTDFQSADDIARKPVYRKKEWDFTDPADVAEVQRLKREFIRKAETRVRQVLEDHRTQLTTLSEALFEKGAMAGSEIRRLIGWHL